MVGMGVCGWFTVLRFRGLGSMGLGSRGLGFRVDYGRFRIVS